MSKLMQLSLEEVEYIAHSLVREMMDYDEPIPDFETRYPGKLESCISLPFQQFDGNDLYPTLEVKTSVLFYSIIKNHPFSNGNKRMAVAVVFTFLFLNNYWMDVPTDALYEIAIKVAESSPGNREQVLGVLQDFFKKFIHVAEEVA